MYFNLYTGLKCIILYKHNKILEVKAYKMNNVFKYKKSIILIFTKEYEPFK